MTLTFVQLQDMLTALDSLKDQKLPFKLSLLIAKNTSLLQKEFEFYVGQEREFALKYLEFDENGQPISEGEGMFKIKDGLQKECMEAREELNKFTCDVELRKLPMSLIENIDFTPEQVAGLELIIDEEG